MVEGRAREHRGRLGVHGRRQGVDVRNVHQVLQHDEAVLVEALQDPLQRRARVLAPRGLLGREGDGGRAVGRGRGGRFFAERTHGGERER